MDKLSLFLFSRFGTPLREKRLPLDARPEELHLFLSISSIYLDDFLQIQHHSANFHARKQSCSIFSKISPIFFGISNLAEFL